MKSKLIKISITLLAVWVSVISLWPVTTYASVMYKTYTKDKYNHLIYLQPPYRPVGIIGKNITAPDPNHKGKMTTTHLQNPSDVFIDSQDHIYVVDTGNNRVVEFLPDGSFQRIIRVNKDPFSQPNGIYVTNNGTMYIADTGNKRIVVMNKAGQEIQVIKKPQSPFIPKSYKFDPIKLVVDKRGFLYVATLGGYQGLLELDPQGKFVSFFGANTASLSFIDHLKKLFYTKKMYANEISKLPGSVDNVSIDNRGFVYTVTDGQGVNSQQIKKLNIKGTNLIAKTDGVVQSSRSFGEQIPQDLYGLSYSDRQPQLVDVGVDSHENISAIDTNFKYIDEYDSNGNLLFFWGGLPEPGQTQLGLLRSPDSLAYNSKDELYILDGQDNLLEKFQLTEFGQMVIKADSLTQQGEYEQSNKLWKQVLHYNAQYPPALLGMAKADYQEGKYRQAMKLFNLTGDKVDYSNSYWQVRLVWFQHNFGLAASLFILLLLLIWIFGKWMKKSRLGYKWRHRKRSKNPIIIQFKHILYILRHPIEGFTAIRYESKGSYWSAIIVLLLAAAAQVIHKYFTGFTFNPANIHELHLIHIVLQFIIVWIAWVVCNYFISSILKGEGRFKDVFISSAYALTPFILLGIPLTILSNGLTLSEVSIYHFMSEAILLWMGLMFIWSVLSVQSYFVGETLVNISATLFSMVMMGVLIFMIYSLSNQLIQFILAIYREVAIR